MKKLARITSVMTGEERERVLALAEARGCTPSRLIRTVMAEETGCLESKSDLQGQVAQIVDAAERFQDAARKAAARGTPAIDRIERAELTPILAEALWSVWNPDKEAA